jgi:luciferase family oxidoreductase group 1
MFPQQVQELQAWVSGAPLPPSHPFRMINAHPMGPTSPELWILGSSDYGAQLAAHFGLPYAFAYFFTDGHGVEQAFELYRDNYKPSERYPKPQATICVWALAADTEAEARHLAAPREHSRVLREYGIREALVSPEEAAAYPYNAAQLASIESMRRKAFVGTAEQVKTGLTALAARLDLDELVVVTWTYDAAARHRSYTLLAQAFALPAGSDALSAADAPA